MMAEQPDHQRLAEMFGELAFEMQSQKGLPDTLRSIVHAATHIVPGAGGAGVSLIEGKKIVSEVPSNPTIAALDELQSGLNEGPCLSALREHHTVHIADMRTETRWPAFAREAQQLGVLSLLSFQLFVRSENLGALNLYGEKPGAFSEESLAIGGILAQHAAVAIIGAAAEMQFHKALASRDMIGQAKGIVMQRDRLNGLQAFNLLSRVSQETNMKLVDVARWVVERHESGLDPGRP